MRKKKAGLKEGLLKLLKEFSNCLDMLVGDSGKKGS